jgi:TPR repeat protein
MKTAETPGQITMFLHKLPWHFGLMFSSLIALCGCVATDPALKSAIAEAERNPKSARNELRPFAVQGQEKAIAALCVAYGRSIDSEVRDKERREAFAWCSHAANTGVLEAQYRLARFYQSGIGVEENKALALRWFTIAGERGHSDAENARRGMLGLPAICKNWITNCKMF